MKIVIFGTGGVGGYFGGRLAQAGNDVTFFARGAHLAAIQNNGLQVDSINGNFIVQPAKATDSPSSIGIADLIILSTKGWQVDEAIKQMKSLIGETTTILPLLNGMEHMDKLFSAFGEEHVIGGMCRVSSFVEAPGVIHHVGVQPFIAYGEWNGSKSERIESIHKLFSSAEGITAEISTDIQRTMWEKYVFITGTSGVGAFTRQPIGEFRENPEARTMLFDIMSETASVARARGVELPENFMAETMKRIDALPYAMTASMQKDMMEGRPSELDDQIGAVIRMGRAANVPTPANERLYAALLPFEQKARGR